MPLQRTLKQPPSLREAGDGARRPGLKGYAALFSLKSDVLYDATIHADARGNPLPFVEVLDPHCFDRTLKENGDVRALHNHNTDHLLARQKSGSLILNADDTGLYFEHDLPDTSVGRDVAYLVNSGDIDGCSFGFSIRDHDLDTTVTPAIHTVYDLDLYEISTAVTFPAYPQTQVTMRSRAEAPVEAPPITRETFSYWLHTDED